MNKNEETIFEKYNLTTPALVEMYGDANKDVVNGDFLKLITMTNALNLGLKPVVATDNKKIMLSDGKTAVFVDDGAYPQSLFIKDTQNLRYAHLTNEDRRRGITNEYLKRLTYDKIQETNAQFALGNVYPYDLPVENLKKYLSNFSESKREAYINQILQNYGEVIDALTIAPWAKDAKYGSNLAADLATFAEEVASLKKDYDHEMQSKYTVEREL